MKVIRNGVIYDTDKSELVGIASASCPTSDFRWWEEELHRTYKTKQYFLVGEGGPMSHYAVERDDSWVQGGVHLRLLSEREALDWAEDHLDFETLEKYFGHLLEEA